MCELMIQKLMIMCGEPESIDPEAYLDEFRRVVGNWSDDVLDEATIEVLKAKTFRGWPEPGECRKACEIAANSPLRRAPLRNDRGDDRPPLTQEQIDAQAETMRRYRERMAAMKLDDEEPKAKLHDCGREAMETMMANSPNQHLYRRLS